MDPDGHLAVGQERDISTVINNAKRSPGCLQGLDPGPGDSPGNCSHRPYSRSNSRRCHSVHDRYPRADPVGLKCGEKKGISGTIVLKILPGTDDTLTCSTDRRFIIGNDGCNGFPEVKPVPDHYQ